MKRAFLFPLTRHGANAHGDLSHKGRGVGSLCISPLPFVGEVAAKRRVRGQRALSFLGFFFLSLFLAGCGFQPLMTGQPETSQKFVLKINGSGYAAYKFRRELEKQLAGTPKVNDKAYVLMASVSEGHVPIAYGTDATVSRSQIQATANYTLQEGAQTVATGNVTAYSTYILNYTEEFSTRSAQTAASERTLINLAEELSREVMLKIRVAPEREEGKKLITSVEQDDNW